MVLWKVRALYAFNGRSENEISFQPGTVFIVKSKSGNWWLGEIGGKVGFFPSNYVCIISSMHLTN